MAELAFMSVENPTAKPIFPWAFYGVPVALMAPHASDRIYPLARFVSAFIAIGAIHDRYQCFAAAFGKV